MPEVPENMQQNLAHLEQQAQGSNGTSGRLPPRQQSYGQNSAQYSGGNDGSYSAAADIIHDYSPAGNASAPSQANSYAQILDQPNFSPFPVLKNLPPNVPPTDEQKEAILESAREAVLASNDPETQLTWAQDTLAYVEIAMQNEQRVSITQPPRSQTPRIEHLLKEDAMKIVVFLSEQHHPKAEFLKGVWLEFGKFGYRIDKKEAFLCYSRALEKGYSRAYYRIGMQFEQSNEPLKAISYYQKGVDAGDSAACYRLGMMALLGQHSQPQDFQRGLNLIYASAQTADENAPQGAYVFGMLQARELAQVSIPERFLPLDVANAKINIEKAAYLGFAKAQVKMGAAYELCELGCEFSPAMSLHYNSLAARQGEVDAEMAISKWFLCGYEGIFEKNEELAFVYAQRAASGGLGIAQFALGYFYEVGIHVPMNLKEARDWYTKAAANGNKDASGRIDSISRSKTISRKDHERIAVSKIRKQHGSHGLSPSEAPPVPVMPPAAPLFDMPDPSRLSLNPNGYGNAYQPLRPSATAPYPMSSQPNGRPQNPDHRPTSAFGINPNLRASSAGTAPGSQMPGPRPPVLQNQPRPYSSTDVPGRPYANGGRMSSGPGPSGRPQQRPPPNATPPLPAKVDIGYSAPPDAGVDRRQRLHRPMGQPSTGQPPLGAAHSQGPQGPSNAPTNIRPYQGRPSQSQRPLQPVNNKPLPQPNTATTSGPGKKPATSTPSSTQAAAPTTSRPPGKGPKTFDEMGVPQGKKDGDCVSSEH